MTPHKLSDSLESSPSRRVLHFLLDFLSHAFSLAIAVAYCSRSSCLSVDLDSRFSSLQNLVLENFLGSDLLVTLVLLPLDFFLFNE